MGEDEALRKLMDAEDSPELASKILENAFRILKEGNSFEIVQT